MLPLYIIIHIFLYLLGGLVLAWASGEFQDTIKAGVIFHPSLSLEERIFGGNPAKVAEKIKCPILLMPAGNDPDIYRTGGDVLEALKYNNSKSNFIDFPNMQHGWVTHSLTHLLTHSLTNLLTHSLNFTHPFTR